MKNNEIYKTGDYVSKFLYMLNGAGFSTKHVELQCAKSVQQYRLGLH